MRFSADRKEIDYRIEYRNVCYRYDPLKPTKLLEQMTANLVGDQYTVAKHQLETVGFAEWQYPS